MSTLPIDVIFEILSWLPETTLREFRLVSKSCSKLITSSTFAESHLNRGYRNDDLPRVFFTRGNNLLCTIECKNDAIYQKPLINKVFAPTLIFSTVGSCNGLVCFEYFGGDKRGLCYYLWNPSSKSVKDVPVAPLNSKSGFVNGFGYDDVLKDYKIITFVPDGDKRDHDTSLYVHGGQLMVYTLGTNSWRTRRHACDRFKYSFRRTPDGFQVNGCLHWIFGDSSIISFNIVDERDQEVPPPPVPFLDRLQVLRGCLCALDCNDGRVDLWMMKDYGMKESWTKLFSISHPELNRISNLLWIGKKGEILVCLDFKSSGGGRFVLYDPISNEVKKLRWPSPSHLLRPIVYFGSLVSIKSGTSTDQEVLRSVRPIVRNSKKKKRYLRDKGRL